jgi:hypothetical protein
MGLLARDIKTGHGIAPNVPRFRTARDPAADALHAKPAVTWLCLAWPMKQNVQLVLGIGLMLLSLRGKV